MHQHKYHSSHQDYFTPSNALSNTKPLDLYETDQLIKSPLLLTVLDNPTMALSQPPLPPRQAPRERSLTQDLRENTIRGEMGEEPQDSQRCLLDFVEWWCYKVIGAKTQNDISSAKSELMKAVENFCEEDHSQPNFGRLHNRIELSAFSWDIWCLSNETKGDHHTPLASHWNMVREELILTKSKLLRQDANADVVLLSSDLILKQQKGIPDLKREQSPLFQSQYTNVVKLVRVQQTLNVFADKLSDLVRATTVVNEGENKRRVREAIEEYETQINLLFAPPKTNKAESDDDESVHSSSSDVRELPQELAGFLLRNLYQTSANAHKHGSASPSTESSTSSSTSSSTALAERLLSHVESILQSSSSKYSQSNCQKLLRQLLLEWHNLVLEAPTLVQLGYGEESTPASSRARKAIAEEDAMLRRLSSDQAGMQDMIEGFRPIQWVDSDSEENSGIFDPVPLEDTPAAGKRSKSLSPRKRCLNSSVTLYTDSEDDPEESPPKKSRKRSRSSDTSSTTRLRISQSEEEAILEGVRKYGVGRWNMVKQQAANGALDKLSPQKIKVAYQQTMRRKNRKNSKSPTRR